MKDSGECHMLELYNNCFSKVLSISHCLLHGQRKQSEIATSLKVLGVRHLNVFADLNLLALGEGRMTLAASWTMTLSNLMNEALCASVYVWHFLKYTSQIKGVAVVYIC